MTIDDRLERLDAVEDAYLLSPLQLGMVFQTRLVPGSGLFHQQTATPLPGLIDAAAFEAAWRDLVAATPALRTTFHWSGLEHPLQVVHRHVPFAVDLLDWTATAPGAFRSRLERHLAARRTEGFDLERPPLMRVELVAAPGGRSWLLWHFHHAVLDGWSSRLLLDELAERYTALLRGLPWSRPQRPPFRGYVEWLQRQDEGEAEDYWRGLLAGFDTPTRLNLPRPRGVPVPAEQSLELPAAETTALVAFAREQRVTLTTVVHAAWALVLADYGDTGDVVFGTVVSGRPPEVPGVEDMVGLFINSVPVRVRVDGSAAWGGWLRALQDAQVRAQPYHHVSPMQVSRWSPLPAATRPYDTLVVVENFPRAATGGGGDAPDAVPLDVGRIDVPLSLTVLPGQPVRLLLRSDGILVDAAALQGIAARLAGVLRRAAGDPGRAVDLVRAAAAVAVDVPGPIPQPDGDPGVLGLLDAVTDRSPGLVPFRDPGRPGVPLSVLRQRIRGLAGALDAAGVGPGDVVGVHLPRSADAVVAMLAAFELGAAYLPLDPAYPDARIDRMVRDSGARAIVGPAPIGDAPAVPPDARVEGFAGGRRPSPADVAYVLFTSGSTGEPKGVAVEHGTLLNRLRWMWRAFPFAESEAGMVRTSANFVDSLWEMLGGLLAGVPSAVASDEDVRDPAALLDLAAAHGVTRIFLVPSYLGVLLERCPEPAGRAPALVDWFVGGEPLTADLARSFHAAAPHARLHNVYGSSELWDVTAHTVDIAALDPADVMVPIGRPIDGVAAFVLDSAGRPVPDGAIGRLCVAGRALPRGHLDPRLDAQRLSVVPGAAGAQVRVFDTGDLAHASADGTIHLDGRRDAQLKVRGVRVEPREIESVLEAHPSVRAAAVVPVARAGGGERLVAFVVATEGTAGCDDAELRRLVGARLPRQMVPARFVPVEALPRTPSGKLDRRALAGRPLPEPARGGARPADGLEATVAAAMAELAGVAGLTEVGPDDDFFADLGGHSLLAVRLCSRLGVTLGVDIPIRDVFDHPTAALLARRVAERLAAGAAAGEEPAAGDDPVVVDRPPTGDFPLSFAQERIWFLDQLAPGSSAYNLATAHSPAPTLEAGALQRALDALVARHESLRTTFPLVDDAPVQRVAPAGPVAFRVVDLRRVRPVRQAAELARFAARAAAEPFDLTTGPLFRAAVVHRSRGDDVFVLVVHHIVADGWSLEVLFAELGALYRAELEGGDPGLPPPGPQYVDVTLRQRRRLTGDALQALREDRRRVLEGAPTLDLPTDRPRPPVQSWRGSATYFELPTDAVDRVRAVARRFGVTPNTVLLGCFLAMLEQYTGQDDLVVGTPVAGRDRADLERVVGFLVDTVVLRVDASGDPTFAELLSRVHATVLDAVEHHELPFPQLVAALRPEQDLSRNPLFQVSFQLLSAHDTGGSVPAGARAAEVTIDKGTSVFDLSFNLVDAGPRIRGQAEFATDLFDAATIRSMVGHFVTLVERLSADPDVTVHAVTMLTGEDHERLERWERGAVDDAETLLPQAILRQAELTPDAVAARDGRGALTYAELVRRARGTAAELHRRAGTGGRIAVLMRPSADLVAGLLAVWLSGNAYVPVDPASPARRIRAILADAGAACVLADAATDVTYGFEVVQVRDGDGDGLPGPPADPAATAYVVYTSGSTGRPKGVVVSHRGVAGYVRWAAATYPAGGAGAPLASSVAADMAVTALFVPLVTGRTVFLLDDGDLVAALDEALRGDTVFSFVKLTPSHLSALRQLAIGRGLPTATRAFVVGGEALHGEAVEPWREAAPELLVWNEYGPTEASVACCAHVATAAAMPDGPVPIGRPVAGAELVVLDRYGRRVPCGVTGELHIGGAGVADGYLGDPELTGQRFGTAPARRFRSGDLVRRDRDGVLHYLGRADRQLKIRGHRVEPGEVESVIRRHPAVRDCVVAARELSHDDLRLIAYVAVHSESPGLRDELTASLRAELPAPMVPGRIVVVDEVPLTRAGKVDTAALDRHAVGAVRAARVPVEPSTDLQRALLVVLEDVLGDLDGTAIGVADDFFADLGGDSLLATKVVARVWEYLETELPVRALFEEPTVLGLAGRIASVDEAAGSRARLLLDVLAMSDQEIEAGLQAGEAEG